MNSVVTKRSGVKTPYDASKIKKSIELATEGLNVNPLVLESKIDLFIKNNITTRDIQKNIIQHAVQLASSKEPQWLNVAGKAYAMDKWADFCYRDKTFKQIVRANCKTGIYTSELLDYYDDSDLEELGKSIIMERDLAYSYAALFTGYKKYIGKTELNQHMHMVNAMRFGQNEPKETRVATVIEFYNAFSLGELCLATPFMSSLRRGGNVASCFILAIEDNVESIFDNVKNIAKISKNGGGLGIYLGKLRASGSTINGVVGAAGSITRWVKIINDTLVAVDQNGLRKGAGTVALPLWHNDILDFLDMQSEHGDVRLKSYDVFPQIIVNDLFMQRDREKGNWTTFCPHEVKTVLGIEMYGLWGEKFEEAYLRIEAAAAAGTLKITQTIEARVLFKTFMRSMFETGLPYVAFIDEINRQNPNQGSGYIPCVNLCVESFSNVIPDVETHVCNLASINLGNIDHLDHLAVTASLAAKILDYGISLTNNPLESTKRHNQRYRTIGIGQMGLHDYLARRHTNYGDLETISDIGECIQYYAAKESVRQAKLHGAFPEFETSQWKTGAMTRKFERAAKTHGLFNWRELQLQIDLYGIRNSQLTSPMPTTSASIYQGASASYLPIYSAFFSEDNSNGSLKTGAKYLEKNPLGYGKTQIKHTPKEIIDITATLQQFTDTGLSMELVFDQNREGFKALDLYDTIHYAHEKKLKSIYYIRTIKRNETIMTKNEENCSSCAG